MLKGRNKRTVLWFQEGTASSDALTLDFAVHSGTSSVSTSFPIYVLVETRRTNIVCGTSRDALQPRHSMYKGCTELRHTTPTLPSKH